MVNTGVVRKIDNLGRIVLPKELRYSFGINSGDDFEILIDNDSIVLRKYYRLDNFKNRIKELIDNINSLNEYNVLLIQNNIINIKDNKIDLSNMLNMRKILVNDSNISNIVNSNNILFPIIVDGDLICGLLIYGNENIEIMKRDINLISMFVKNIILNKM